MQLTSKPCAVCGAIMYVRRMTKTTCSTQCRVILHHSRKPIILATLPENPETPAIAPTQISEATT